MGGIKQSQDSQEMINIQCAAETQPQLYFFDIEIFNKTLWIFLLIGSFLIPFAYQYYNMILKL